MPWHVTLENEAGPIDERRVRSNDPEKVREAVEDIVREVAYFNSGDIIRIREV